MFSIWMNRYYRLSVYNEDSPLKGRVRTPVAGTSLSFIVAFCHSKPPKIDPRPMTRRMCYRFDLLEPSGRKEGKVAYISTKN